MRWSKPIEASIIRMFFEDHMNTAQIARKLKMPEYRVDNHVARELGRKFRLTAPNDRD